MTERTEKLADAIGMIRDEYVVEASETRAKQPNTKRRRWVPVAAAACLVLALGVGVFAAQSAMNDSKSDIVETSTERGYEDGYVRMDDTRESSFASSTAGADSYGGGTGKGGDSLTTPEGQDPVWDPGEAFVLTAAEWNDNNNWPFFTNLVNAGTIAFPSFGLDPCNRVRVTVTDATGFPLAGYPVTLRGESGDLWHARTDKNGVAVLFFENGEVPLSVECDGETAEVSVQAIEDAEDSDDQQRKPATTALDDVTIEMPYVVDVVGVNDLQVMFIVDTTGSMADEITYLQKDFSQIAADVQCDCITYSVNFYRDEGDEYVTKCNPFTEDVTLVQQLINAEYAEGGGDTPEAVAQILTETITDNSDWRDESAKIAFLIFDAPPHDGTDQAIQAAVASAAARGIKLVPVVASNAERDTELFGRALAIMTNGTYVFLTDDSGVGGEHLEPIVGDYTVELLHDVIVRIIDEAK